MINRVKNKSVCSEKCFKYNTLQSKSTNLYCQSTRCSFNTFPYHIKAKLYIKTGLKAI